MLKKQKQKLQSAIKLFFLGSIMRKSSNYLPLTHRERAMVNWFSKFSFTLLFLAASWVMPARAINGHMAHVRALEAQVSQIGEETQHGPILEAKAAADEPVEIKSETIREVTAYNAGDPAQTDASPCISANGEDICAALEAGFKRCAANFVPFGTDLLITTPDASWSYRCKVTDRMNSRFPNRVDIAMKLSEKERAINFGKQNLIVKIIK